MANPLLQRLKRWARRRQGPDRGQVELTDRRVYILPTRTGLTFGVVLFTMLLGSLNYSNNMGFALVFILASVTIVTIHHCQRNLAGLRLTVAGGLPVFAGDAIECEVRIANPGRHQRWQITAGEGTADATGADVPPGDSATLRLRLATTRRGRLDCPEVRISTRYPLGFFRSWSWIYPDLELLAYPQPADRVVTGHPAPANEWDTDGDAARGADEFVGLRPLEPGEARSRIAWNAFARTGQLLAKDYRTGTATAWIDWNDVPGTDTEAKLSILARMALDAESAGRAFGLRLPGAELSPAAGTTQLHRCLRALALFELPVTGGPRHGP